MPKEYFKFSRLAKLSALASLFLFISCGSDRESQSGGIFVAEDFSRITISKSESAGIEQIRGQKNYDSFLKLYVQNQDGNITEGQLPVIGSYQLINSRLVFKPSYKFVPGRSYTVRLKRNEGWLEKSFTIPASDLTPTTAVAQVYPSASVLPRNLLKFYIQFTDSMSARFSYQNITLINEAQDTIHDAFLELEEELWSPDMKRFTLLFDPGRIKRGLGSQDDMGYTFHVGQKYSLVISSSWPDAQGKMLLNGFKKEFEIRADDRARPNPDSWSIVPPQNNLDSLHVNFKEPLDYGLANRVIEVLKHDGTRVPGKAMLNKNESQWTYKPEAAWFPGGYTLRIERILEDLSGNNIKNLFDVDNQKQQTDLSEEPYHLIPFKVN